MIHAGVLAFLVFPGLLLLWVSRSRLAGSPWPAALAGLAFGAAQVRDALANVRDPREWDYACFWLYAHVARTRENLYDPSVFQRFPLPLRVDRDFVQAVSNVGFPYPPPSIALFVPLAAFDGVSRGLAFWYAAQLVAFGVAVYALQRALFPRDGLRAIVLVAALALLLPALATNTSQAQTNLWVLALIALAFLARENALGSIWYVLAIWVKPYALALVLFDIATGRVRRLGFAILTVIASLAASLVLLEPRTFATYFVSNPSLREPSYAFVESVNQSLLATSLRMTHATLGAHVLPLHQPIYVATAALLLAVTTVLCARYRERSDLCFSLTLMLGLLLYPGTLESYGTVAILPILVLWSHRDALPLQGASVAVVASAVVLLQGPFHSGFVANALLWSCTALALAKKDPERTWRPGSLASA